MHKKQENQYWNKGIAILLMALMIALPAEYAYAQAIVDVPGQQFSNVAEDIVSDLTQPPSSEEMIGEDILVNVNHYDPPVISTTLIEDQGANVFALLEGQSTNPTIEIAGIRRIVTRPVKITTIPPNKPISIGSIQHITPRSAEMSYDNLGYLVIPIRRIPREADVPYQIDIDMVSRIYFDVSAGLSAGPYEDVLVKQEYQQWLQHKDDHSFYAGYIRADEITPTSATFTLYDKDLQEFGTYTAKEGSTSSVINTYRRGYASTGRLFDKLRIRVNEIRGRDDKVKMYVTQDDVTSYKILSKGQRIAPSSSWYIADIKISQDKSEVVLKNDKQQSETFLLNMFVEKATITIETQESTNNQPQYWICPKPRDEQGNIITPHFLNTNDCPHGVEGDINKQKPPQMSFSGTCEWVIPSGNAIEDCQGTGNPPKQAQEVQDPTTKAVQQFEQAVVEECSLEQVREDMQGCYDETIKVVHESSWINTLPSTLRNRVYANLLNIRSTLIGYQREIQLQQETANNPLLVSKEAAVSKALVELDDLIEKISSKSSPEQEKDLSSTQALQKAKQSYQRIIDEYPNSNEAPHAMFRLGKIYWQENNIPLALQTFEKIMSKYDEDEIDALQTTEGVSSNYIAKIIRDLRRAKESLTTTSGMKNLQEKDGTITAVTVIEVEDVLPDSEAAVKIRINNKEHTYRLGNILTLEMPDAMDWEITNVKDNEVTITSRPKNKAAQSTTATLRTGSAKSIQLNEGNKEKKISVELLSTDLQREAHIVIEPAAEQAFSEAHYTLHLPIEKRPFGLPLFSDSLDGEIAKTEKLLAKLDKLIQQATDIHETWTKFCYVAYGWIWLKNTLWFGKGKETVARNKVNEVYREKYASNELNCEGLSYEQCIMQKYEDEYESDMSLTEDIIDEFDSPQYEEFADQFQLDENYDEDKKNLYLYKRLHEERGQTDERLAQKYFTGLKNLQVRSVETTTVKDFYTDKKFLKEYQGLSTQQREAVRATVEKMPSLQGLSVEEAYNKNKENVLRNYKEERMSQEMHNFFTQLPAENDVEREIISNLETSYFRPPITKTELPKSLIMKNGNQYYIALNGNTYILTDVDDAKYNQPIVTTSAIGDTTYVFTDNVKEEEHRKTFTLGSTGPEKGKVEFLTVDALHYIQVSYTDAGRVGKMEVFQRPEANGPIGTEADVRVQEYNEAMEYAKKNNPQLYNRLVQAQSCLSNMYKKAS
ncbi:MAG: tetratricopeptide repeat protein [Nanoarchaeota archaeon]